MCYYHRYCYEFNSNQNNNKMASNIIFKFRYRFATTNTRCLMIHPVSYPNKGPVVQQYLAEQAIGLAKSLGWDIVKGPFWNSKSSNIVPLSLQNKPNYLYIDGDVDEIRDGDYIRTSIGNGILQNDGIIFDEEQSQSQGDLYKQWRNKILRESLANSSLMKLRRVTKKTYFSKGKLHFLAEYIRKKEPDCLYINSELKPSQVKNLKKYLQARINNISISSAFKSSEEGESETQFQTQENSELTQRRQKADFRKIKIFDRFSIILQIFAQRSTTKLAKLQIELSYLNYLRTRLVREGATYSSNLNIFYGDLMQAQEIVMEVISAKQRRAARTMSGEGQSQLEIERRNLRDKEAAIRRQIEEETRLRHIVLDKNKRRGSSLPVVALVGYTNVGKSAFMNFLMKKQEVSSKDLLFQTLNTTSRHVTLPSGTKIALLDTIGFITNLPVELVEAFKATLEQIAHADLVLHLRDISHPQNQLQKDSVLKILKELGFEQSFYQQRMLQVWNKVDLLQSGTQSDLLSISCLTGQGFKQLITKIEERLKVIGGKQNLQIEYGIQLHSEVLQWLKSNTNASFNVETIYNYQSSPNYPSGSVKIKIDLDEATQGKLDKFLNPNKPRNKTKKGMPPTSGW